MGVGCGALYLSKTTTWLKKLDASFVMIALSYQSGEQFVHQLDAQSDVITINSVSKAQGQTNQVQSIQITDDPDKIFESSPPSALDYAIILTSLHKRGYKEVILTTSLNWDQQLGLETQGLGRQLAMFSRSAICPTGDPGSFTPISARHPETKSYSHVARVGKPPPTAVALTTPRFQSMPTAANTR